MAIDILNDRSFNGMKESVATANKVATNTTSANAAPVKQSVSEMSARSADAVMLTDGAKTLSKATQKARDASGVDEAKVEKLKNSIKDGTYKINYESIANKLIDAEDELGTIFG